ncbi:hypothetical protein T07_3335 [Trichinella nelsoni]|uniref:Uncharacterized protein n=1 Tax=Trichinella nelsoni TaxID=6336 RepID=A0A0V0RGT5_9BILA|nr:hypothetical protein T07_3335 [Trichinella nelsoni]
MTSINLHQLMEKVKKVQLFSKQAGKGVLRCRWWKEREKKKRILFHHIADIEMLELICQS